MSRHSRLPLAFLIFGAIGLLFFYRRMVLSGFTLVPGDLGDARHINLLLEHWFGSFLGQVPLLSPNFFFPESRTLGYSEALSLWALPYASLRLAGASVYSAFQGILLLLSSLAYAAMYVLLRRGLHCRPLVAALVSSLFAFSNQFTTHMGHPHLLSTAFVPLLAYFAVTSLDPDTADRDAVRCGLGASALLAMLTYTCFNVAWFVVLFAILLAACLLGLRLVRGEHPGADWPRAWQWPRNAALVAGVFAIFFVPFVLIYAPVWHDLGTRSFIAAAPFLPSFRDLVNVGAANLVWGTLLAATPVSGKAGGPSPLGTPLLLLSCFAYFSVRALRTIFLARAFPDRSTWISGGLASAVLISWLLIISVNGHSLWRLVFVVAPGANAIRVVNRYQLVLYIAMCIVVALGLNRLDATSPSSRRARVLVSALAPLLLAEHVNEMPLFDKVAETARLARSLSPPSACRSFFADNRPSLGRPFYAFHTDAGLVARLTGIPTVNGYSSNFPRGWNLLYHDRPGYASAVAEWVVTHSLGRGLCALDLERGAWRQVERTAHVTVTGIDLLKGPTGSFEEALAWAQDVSMTGFHASEPAGRWTNGHALITFAQPVPSQTLSLTIASYNPRPVRMRIVVDGTAVVDMALRPGVHAKDVAIPRSVTRIELASDTFVPRSIGLNSDDRTLGVLLVTMILR